jgi:trehalose-phosphatase
MVTTRIVPERHRAVLFDMDVLTDTARLHAGAWQRLFDAYLTDRSDSSGEVHRSFRDEDYRRWVEGKPRVDGVLDFLRSRGIELPRGQPDDAPSTNTAHGLGALKDIYFKAALATDGVDVLDGAVTLLEALRAKGVRTAVISASKNCAAVLDRAGLAGWLDARVDGQWTEHRCLPGKPDPATFLEAAHLLNVGTAETVVIEDSRAGIEAGKQGGFALVIGVDRTGEPEHLRHAGADAVVSELDDISVAASTIEEARQPLSRVPEALAHWTEIASRLQNRPAFVFDFDGTLADIAPDPAAVVLSAGARALLRHLADHAPTAVISGRDLRDAAQRVQVDGFWYAGSHGFEISGPRGETFCHPAGLDARNDLDDAQRRLDVALADVPGVALEPKRCALAVHYRKVERGSVERVLGVIDDVAADLPELRQLHGRQVVELLPRVEWDKGRALLWLLDHIGHQQPRPECVFYAGDDVTDEDALRVVHDDGVGVVVVNPEHGDRETYAHYAVDSPTELITLLDRVTELVCHRASQRP